MKKIIYFVGFSFLAIGLNSCGESKAVVVGEGEGMTDVNEENNQKENNNQPVEYKTTIKPQLQKKETIKSIMNNTQKE